MQLYLFEGCGGPDLFKGSRLDGLGFFVTQAWTPSPLSEKWTARALVEFMLRCPKHMNFTVLAQNGQILSAPFC